MPRMIPPVPDANTSGRGRAVAGRRARLLTAGVAGLTAESGWTPNELARLLRVSPDRIRDFIRRGELLALNLARHRCGKPRYVILPHHLAESERGRQAAAPQPPKPKHQKQSAEIDFYPD